jgi:hypothetical protein
MEQIPGGGMEHFWHVWKYHTPWAIGAAFLFTMAGFGIALFWKPIISLLRKFTGPQVVNKIEIPGTGPMESAEVLRLPHQALPPHMTIGELQALLIEMCKLCPKHGEEHSRSISNENKIKTLEGQIGRLFIGIKLITVSMAQKNLLDEERITKILEL